MGVVGLAVDSEASVVNLAVRGAVMVVVGDSAVVGEVVVGAD